MMPECPKTFTLEGVYKVRVRLVVGIQDSQIL